MTTDPELIDANLLAFYNFTRKTVIAVGVGGACLFGYARHARFVIAVDTDDDAINRLAARVRKEGLASRFFLFHGDVMALHLTGDVVLFEFSLHENRDAAAVLGHAAALAPEIVLMEHAPGSPRCRLFGVDRGVAACWAGVPVEAVCRQLDVDAFQHFDNFEAVLQWMRAHGITDDTRAADLRGQAPVAIGMPYRVALLNSDVIARKQVGDHRAPHGY